MDRGQPTLGATPQQVFTVSGTGPWPLGEVPGQQVLGSCPRLLIRTRTMSVVIPAVHMALGDTHALVLL